MHVIETERLALRHLSAADARALEAVFCDPEVMRYSGGLQSPALVWGWVAEMIEVHYPAWGFGIWAVVEKAEGAVIGYCGLERSPGRCGPDEAEIGYRLAHAAWGRGYGSEAAAAVCDHGLGTLGLTRIVAIIDPGNAASLRVALKIGMCYQREVMFEGYTHPDHVYAIS